MPERLSCGRAGSRLQLKFTQPSVHTPQTNPHRARGSALVSLPAVSSIGGFRTPAAGVRGQRRARPASETLHRTGRSDLTCHWIRRARFRRRPGRNCIPTRRDKTYPPIVFQPDRAWGIYRETQESRYAFAVFKSAVSKPSLKRSYTGCRRLRASAIRP